MAATKTGIAVIGGGPAGLMAAEVAASGGAAVTLYDAMPSLGRKFLMAGRGGLNLTHSEEIEAFLGRYREASGRLRPAIEAFPAQSLRGWAEGLGEETLVGSSGRVFPRSWKASPLLRAWLRRLGGLGIRLALRHRWTGWSATGDLLFETPEGRVAVRAPAATVLALGGASWPRLGADGSWVPVLASAGIEVAPIRPSNAGLRISWSEIFARRFAGRPLKRIAISCGGETRRGEAMITETGMEGGTVYALSAAVRAQLDRAGEAILHLDLRPDLSEAALAAALSRPRARQSLSTWLRKTAGLAPVAIGLLREGTEPLPAEAPVLARRIKALPLRAEGTAWIERAISTAGGVRFCELDADFMLRKRPGTFLAGEMIDWDAPTGGYLLQACFATGAAAGRGALRHLSHGLSGGAGVDGAPIRSHL
ncbi:TIGR03862 family flavoprotein [Enterovirga sp.]|uniref:NAD(P)/FAD-dependent oxidoreductase n=1 Tax=Enterovirga sp. TaxID=2026350 RepID=UPI002C0E2CF3|nr:TIGR03862 family flavoprotein [Enterovirga sp.]HMO28980.1 TIGR03862 family flavoprotein [Enterovirga sp.]